MNATTQQVLRRIYANLPLFAEEGGEFSVVSVQSLIDANQEHPLDAVVTAIQIVQQLLLSLRVLDESYIEQQKWRFISFPASLLGRSALQCLLDEKQALFHSEFWQAADSSSPMSEKQRAVLHLVETQREDFHSAHAAPIRYVHVAWGLVVLDGKVLLRHREDRNRPELNNYVLVGGRMSQNDLRQTGITSPLAILQSPAASDHPEAVITALIRELHEETELQAAIHYSARLLRTIKPYRAVEGAGANHALTEYRIHLFSIDLNRLGMFKLRHRMQTDPALVWFSLEEFLSARSRDGKMAYIDALIEDFASPDEWRQWAGRIPASYLEAPQFASESHAITIPVTEAEVLEMGRTGKEAGANITLSEFQANLLVGLVGCLTKYAFTPSPGVIALGAGWIKLQDNYLIQETGRLANKLAENGLPIILSANEYYFRIDVSPECCFFSESAFSFSVSEKQLTLTRKPLQTPLGLLDADSLSIPIARNLARDIERIASGQPPTAYQEEDFNKLVRREIRPACQKLGLRTLVRIVAKKHVIKVVRSTMKREQTSHWQRESS